MAYRLTKGGDIDRRRPLNFKFNGKRLSGFHGDTLASALLANDVSIVGRSFKYHRPRGIMGAREEDPNGIVDLGGAPFGEPNARVTLARLYDGLEARSVNCWPNPEMDFGSLLGFGKPFFSAGFYYKTFKWPSWGVFEPAIRRSAGLGNSPTELDPDRYEHKNVFYDILIIGSGPAGLAAAAALAPTGLSVLLIEQDWELGGGLMQGSEKIDEKPCQDWVKHIVDSLNTQPNVQILSNTTALGYYDGNLVTALERREQEHGQNCARNLARERLWHIRAQKIMLATGAHERPLVFKNNDRPGVRLASAVGHFLNRYAVACGKKTVIFTNNSSAYDTAFQCDDHGVHISAIVDTRHSIDKAAKNECYKRSIDLITGAQVTNVLGKNRVRGVVVQDLTGNETKKTIACDCLAVSGGWSPIVHLFSHALGRLKWSNDLLCFLPVVRGEDILPAGAANGKFNTLDCLEDGIDAARTIVRSLRQSDADKLGRQAYSVFPKPAEYSISEFWVPSTPYSGKSCWVDHLHDVTVGDVKVASQEGFSSVELFKRYTTTGMAPDQGKTSNIIGLALLAQQTGKSIQEVGTTKFRPPYTPVTMGALAGPHRGNLYQPLRHLSLHDFHIAMNARMEDYSGWLRPAFYFSNGEDEGSAIKAEVLNTRQNVGILDYSPLGKIDVLGRDAEKFLNLLYANDVCSLKIGKTRYGLFLNEDGSIKDDGVFGRIAEEHFMLTTTSGGAATIANWLNEWLQCEWPDLDIIIIPFTSCWGTIALAGPKARDVILKLDSDINFSSQSFPHMSVRIGTVENVPVRIFRVSFSGEVTYEVSAPVDHVLPLWTCLLEAGAEFGISPFGLEALMVMRTEKGFIHIGSETDSSSIPGDVGFGALGRKKKVHFIGRRSLLAPDSIRQDREQLVGLETVDSLAPLPAGGQIVTNFGKHRPTPMEGRVTSSHWSPTLNKPVALGVLKSGRRRLGEEVLVYHLGATKKARVVEPCFYDPEGVKMNG